MKNQLLPNRANQLIQLGREINERQQVIDLQKQRVAEAGSSLVCEAIFQGAALLKVKAILKHGDFMPWVRSHCPLISHTTANTYMRLANSTRSLAADATSIREAMLLCAPENPASETASKPRRWPPWLQGLNWFGKFAGVLEKNPFERWPTEGREKLRAALAPLAAQVWPEKFKE